MSDQTIGLALAVGSSLFIGASFIVKKRGLRLAGSTGLRAGQGGFSYLAEPTWWAGMISMILGEAANFAAYAFAPAILVTPLGALSIIISAILAHMLLNERLNMFGMLGCALCITGSMTIVLHAPEERVLGSVVEVWQLAMQPVFIGYIVFAVSTIVFLIWYVAPMHGTSNVFVYLGICSLAGSLSVMSCKALGIALKLTFQGDNQLVFVETHVCIAALDLYNTAIVSPVYYVMFTVLTIVASVIMFNDIQSPVQLATEACGFLTIVGGTFLLHSTRDLDVSLADLGRLTAAHKAAGQPDAVAWSASGAGPGQACVLMGALGSRERDKEKAEARDRLGMGNGATSAHATAPDMLRRDGAHGYLPVHAMDVDEVSNPGGSRQMQRMKGTS
ncbi:probable magnesium transporter [Haematococcus lacustris]|uniref:Probable magnesium transporter n=1 Tax=Haematococcus lacustris TaxID=44745 RepID=A0A699ZE28_HAELA|nr:probable magnesium transporter [Haematococcus lacustris]